MTRHFTSVRCERCETLIWRDERGDEHCPCDTRPRTRAQTATRQTAAAPVAWGCCWAAARLALALLTLGGVAAVVLWGGLVVLR